VETTTAKRTETPVFVENDPLENLFGLDSTDNTPRQKSAPSDGRTLAQLESALDVLLTKLLKERTKQREAARAIPLRAFSALDKSAQIASGPGFAKFEACQMVWDTVPLKAEHTRIKFPSPLESTVSGIVADFHNPPRPVRHL